MQRISHNLIAGGGQEVEHFIVYFLFSCCWLIFKGLFLHINAILQIVQTLPDDTMAKLSTDEKLERPPLAEQLGIIVTVVCDTIYCEWPKADIYKTLSMLTSFCFCWLIKFAWEILINTAFTSSDKCLRKASAFIVRVDQKSCVVCAAIKNNL